MVLGRYDLRFFYFHGVNKFLVCLLYSEFTDGMLHYLELYLDQGKEITIPINKAQFKGKIAYRTSAERHYIIAKIAQQKHKSLSKILDMLVDEWINHTHLSPR